jgi:hypothetical protein
MSYTNIVTNGQVEFINALHSAEDYWMFFHEDSIILSILTDSRKFSQIPKTQIKAAAMKVMPNPECDIRVKCVRCSSIVYDYDTDKITFKDEDEDEDNAESRIVHRMHYIKLKGTKGIRPSSPKIQAKATISRKSSRNSQHSESTGNESSKRQKSTTPNKGSRSKDRKVDKTSNFFSGVSF